jgi:hypothetical protein
MAALIGCESDPQWDKLEQMYLFDHEVKDFDSKDASDILKNDESNMVDVSKARDKFLNSQRDGNSSIWKGGTCYAIAKFDDGKIIKMRLSSNYGVYYILETDSRYSIEGDENLRHGRWNELIIK